jgi:uncharacterized delta-60 repeat protein
MAFVVVLACAAAASPAATSSTVVGATVPSATNLDVAACPGGTPGVTDFGSVLPGSGVVTTADCTVTFGSSNDTAALRLYQEDRGGIAMYGRPAGPLDFSLDTDGIAEASAGVGEVIEDMAVLGDGKIILVGTRANNVLVMRLQANGALDPTFNGSGFIEHDLGGTEAIRAVDVDGSGRLVLAGARGSNSLLMRLTAAGALDPTFDADGWREYDMFAGNVDDFEDVRHTTAGRILAMGDHWPNSATTLLQIHGNGDPDASFGTGGQRVYDVCPACQEFPAELGLLDDGRFVIATTTTGGQNRLAVSRYLATGAPDPTFAGGLVAQVDVGDGFGRGVAVLPDRRVVVVGGADTYDNVGIARFTSTGGPDPTFGTAGIAKFNLGAVDRAEAVIGYPDGSLLVTGTTGNDLFVLRTLANGTLDTRFGTNGIITIDSVGADVVRAMSPGLDGDVVVAGNSVDDALVARLSADTIADYAPGVNDWAPTGSNHFGVCLDAVNVATTTPDWTVDADTCTASDGDPWRGVPASGSLPAAKVAHTNASTLQTGSASLRFGFRTSGSQAPGLYVAPLTFEVVAPNA